MQSEKQILLLCLISTTLKITDIFRAVKIFDKVDFSAKMTEDLNLLILADLVKFPKNLENRAADGYQITEEGSKFLKSYNFSKTKNIECIKTIDESNLLLQIIETYANG